MSAKPGSGGFPSRSALEPRLTGLVCRRYSTANATRSSETSSLARGSRCFVSRFVASDRQNTCTDQVREPLPLFRAQERVDLLKGIHQRVANFRGALYASFAGTAGLGGIERLAGNGIGELRQGAAVVHLGLCPFRLELVQDSGQFGDLFLVQIELVGEESERPSDAKPRPSLESISLFVMMAGARHKASSALTTLVVFFSIGFVNGLKRLVALSLAP